MREVIADMWDLHEQYAPKVYSCITTNNTVRDDGAAVMGAGVALGAKMRYPGIQYTLGARIQNGYYQVEVIGGDSARGYIMNFPVKYEVWKDAELGLIRKSTEELAEFAKIFKNYTFILPRPGCGVGGLTWPEVKPIVKVLPDNVLVVDKR